MLYLRESSVIIALVETDGDNRRRLELCGRIRKTEKENYCKVNI